MQQEVPARPHTCCRVTVHMCSVLLETFTGEKHLPLLPGGFVGFSPKALQSINSQSLVLNSPLSNPGGVVSFVGF